MERKRQLHQGMRVLGATLVSQKNHLKWQLPNGRLIVTSQSPSDVRALRNVVRQVCRAGIDRETAKEAFGV